MPELPEVETVCRQVRPFVVGQRIVGPVWVSRQMARPRPRFLAPEFLGVTIERLDRQGKWMFFRLTDSRTLVVHLGMTGRLSVQPVDAEVDKHTHFRLPLEHGQELRLADPRRFGELLLWTADEMEKRFGPKQLGPDALTISSETLAERIAGTKRKLKATFMDQRVLAGIGNIYADEILFDAGLSPSKIASALDKHQMAKLVASMRKILKRSIAKQGTSIRDYVTGDGVPGEFQEQLRVYGRGGQPCRRCQFPIELSRTIVTGRATYWCPGCQTG